MVLRSHVSCEASCENASRENGGVLPRERFVVESDSRLDEDFLFLFLQKSSLVCLELDHGPENTTEF